jgi:hypothetical protein
MPPRSLRTNAAASVASPRWPSLPRAAVIPADPTKRLAIALGTGFGCLDEGAVFIENLVAKDEAEPMPTRFPGSVHNAPAGQVAIDLGATGLNSAPTMGEISFESALWQAMNQIANGEADEALAGGVDELNKYALSIGKRWGFWNDQTIPGEAAVVANLAGAWTNQSALARVTAVRLGRYRRPFDAQREVDWIAQAMDLSKIETMVVTGANGWPELDAHYHAVVAELSRNAPAARWRSRPTNRIAGNSIRRPRIGFSRRCRTRGTNATACRACSTRFPCAAAKRYAASSRDPFSFHITALLAMLLAALALACGNWPLLTASIATLFLADWTGRGHSAA